MEGHLRQTLPYPRNITDYNNRRISSCSSGSASSSSYASSEDNMFIHRHMENNNIPRHFERHYHSLSHDNQGYNHEELLRSDIRNSTRLVNTDSGLHHNCLNGRLRMSEQTECCHLEGTMELAHRGGHVNEGISEQENYGSKNLVDSQNSLLKHQNSRLACSGKRAENSTHCQQQQGEQMCGRPLPLTPENDISSVEERISRAATPLRYQNDSPFVSSARSGSDSLNSIKRSFTRSQAGHTTIQSVDERHTTIQSVDERQKSAEDLLKQVPWFQPKLTREEVLEKLSREELGSFIIRESSTHSSCFALSVKVPKFNNPTGIAHYIVHRTPSQGFRIKGLEKEWTNLSSLVVHHTIMPELLPCTLKVPRPVSSRRHSTTSRGSNSSRASSGSASPSSSMNSKPSTPSQLDRLVHSLERNLTVNEVV